MKKLFMTYSVLLLSVILLFHPSVSKTEMSDPELQEWDVQKNEVIEIMRERLLALHQIYIESIGIDTDEYNPDDYYSYQIGFDAYNSDYGILRYWTCCAFYLNMPYTGWFIRVDSPSGELRQDMPLTLAPALYTYNKNDDLRAAQEVIDTHKHFLLSYLDQQIDYNQVTLLLDIDNEYLGAWCSTTRVIPLKLSFPEISETREYIGLFVLIRVEKNFNFSQHYCWSIKIFTQDAIREYAQSDVTSESFPVFFSDGYIIEEQKEILY